MTEPNHESVTSVTAASGESVTSTPATTRNENIQITTVIERLENKIAEHDQFILNLAVTKLKNCEEIRSKDRTKESGMYCIDPDGYGIGDDPMYPCVLQYDYR